MEVSFAAIAASTAVAVVLLVWAWRVVNWVWLKPKMLENYLKKQGLSGTSYTPLVGDLRKTSSMLMDARSKPIDLRDDIIPRVLPFVWRSMKTYGKTFYTWFGPIPAITLTNPDQIKEVLNKVYDFPKTHTFPLARLIATGIVTYDGEKWTKHRRIINPAFHLEKIKNMVPAFYQSCSEMVNKWEKLVEDKGSSCEVDVWPWLVNLTADVISRTAFGSSYEEGQRVFQLQAELARLLVKASIRTGYIPGWRFLPTRDNKRMKEIDQEIRDILRGVISKREKAREAGEAPKDDLLGILLQSNSDESQGDGMSVEEVIEECKLFYFAGQETTTVLLVWTMVLLSYYPDWQARAREEVLQVFGDKKPEFDGLNHLKVVTMIFCEVLRLYPPVVNLHRTVHKEMKLGDLTIPPGVQVSLPILLVHRNTKLWGDDALEFKPERFKDGLSQATKNQVSFFPFAWGPRICVGQNFALLEAKMAMALILQRFSFKLSPSYTHAPCSVITIHPQFGAHLILHKV